MTDFITAKVVKVAATFVYVGSAYSLPDVNVVLNMLGLLAIIYFGPKYLKTRDLQAQLSAKDVAIATNDQSIEALERRVKVLEDELRGTQERANLADDRSHRAEQREQEWKARYDEQARYTAGPAFVELREIIVGLASQMDKRHEEMLQLMARLAGEQSVIRGSSSS